MKKLFKRWSKKLDKMVSVIGSEDQIKNCIVCKQDKNQKHFHLKKLAMDSLIFIKIQKKLAMKK